ncbi:alcohol dehydrogenase catalytic domain-containing protein [Iamia sp. SCSIO 61187]|uniref:alcohol dehydrogenase catalytic domain-containing protein n=1 Tax=Iamia sp. SCSIO 61187 TaxID=2722752 RepID=UPI001C631E32|nr:alcohol dehydrogenase catalytic domain-containing protein [Iamia sp. SCSIO 61187]QYG91733.1 alcohol dehydrogenase catalytic domain-containing protein [Iamia sp. SCSIO 61187]
MRQLTYTNPGEVRWTEMAVPEDCPADGAVVRPQAVGRCDLDAPMVTWGMFPGPFPVGHEVAGVVEQVGDHVHRVRPGEEVVVPFQVSCGQCRQCGSGRYAACGVHRAAAGAAFGFGSAGGGFGGAVADVLVVPHADHLLFPAPLGLSVVERCVLADNVVDGFRCVAGPLDLQPGAEVLIVGGAAESVGLYAVSSALALGASRVRYVDTDIGRCDAAEGLGAEVEHVVGAWPRRFDRAPVTVALSLDPDGLRAAIMSTEPYGTCTSAAIHLQPVELPLLQMYSRGITFHTSRADSRRHLPRVLEAVDAGRLSLDGIPMTVAPFDEAEDVWLEAPGKLVLTH